MADDLILNPGAGGDTIAADDILGVKYQRVKISVGADGSAADNSTAAPLAVKISDGTDVALVDGSGNLNTVVSGTVAVTQSGTWDEVGINDSGNSITVDNGGTFAVQDSQVVTEDAASAGGEKLFLAGAVRRDTAASSSTTDGDYSTINTDSSGRLWVNASGAAVPITDNSGSLTVDAPVGTPVFVRLSDGSAAISTLPVSLASVPSHAVTNAGTFAVQDSEKIADDAAFTVASTKVLPIGLLADETSPDSVNEGDIGAPRMTLDRMIRVVVEESDTIRANGTSRTVSRAAIAAASSGNNTLVTNSNGGLTVRVYALTIVAAAAVSLYFTADAGGTVVFGGSTNKISLAANSGLVLPFNPAGWFATSANTDVVMNLSGAVAVSGGIVYAEV